MTFYPLALASLALLACCSGPKAPKEEAPARDSGIPAFPGAEGFGGKTPGGRGGKLLLVTNLKDYVPGRQEAIAGSLRAACAAKGPRIVIFRVSGTIPLKTGLRISEPYLTLAGQSAPGGGICLKHHGTFIETHDVVLRHLRFRPGDELGPAYKKRGKSFSPDSLAVNAPSHDVIIDHCSVSWSIDECLSVAGAGITNVTVQWCIISESLNDSFHAKGPHGYGSLLRTNGKITFHHNLYAHHKSRSPRPGTYGEGSILLDFTNNVIHDSNGYSGDDAVRMNYVGNYIKRPRKSAFNIGGEATRIYVAGNFLEGGGQNESRAKLITGGDEKNRMPTAFAVAPVSTETAARAYERILSSCGAILPERDAVDARIITQLEQGGGGIIDSQIQVGGWAELRSSTAPADADRDGLPDAWEIEHGLDPDAADDAGEDADGDGYTNAEEWLNGTDPNIE